MIKLFKKLFSERFLSTSMAEVVKPEPLKLNLQFFAEDPPGDDDLKDPPGDGDELTLNDLLKTNPKIKADYKTRVETAINKRFKDIDPEEARTAIAEKKQRDADKAAGKTEGGEDLTIAKQKTEKLEGTAKRLSVAAYAAASGFDPKLVARLAGDKISELKLNDNYELDADDMEDVLDSLKEEFPSLFVAADPNTDPLDTVDPVKVKRQASSQQQLNTPPAAKGDPRANVAARIEALKKNKRL